MFYALKMKLLRVFFNLHRRVTDSETQTSRDLSLLRMMPFIKLSRVELQDFYDCLHNELFIKQMRAESFTEQLKAFMQDYYLLTLHLMLMCEQPIEDIKKACFYQFMKMDEAISSTENSLDVKGRVNALKFKLLYDDFNYSVSIELKGQMVSFSSPKSLLYDFERNL